jgi:hypothetical protein
MEEVNKASMSAPVHFRKVMWGTVDALMEIIKNIGLVSNPALKGEHSKCNSRRDLETM